MFVLLGECSRHNTAHAPDLLLGGVILFGGGGGRGLGGRSEQVELLDAVHLVLLTLQPEGINQIEMPFIAGSSEVFYMPCICNHQFPLMTH